MAKKHISIELAVSSFKFKQLVAPTYVKVRPQYFQKKWSLSFISSLSYCQHCGILLKYFECYQFGQLHCFSVLSFTEKVQSIYFGETPLALNSKQPRWTPEAGRWLVLVVMSLFSPVAFALLLVLPGWYVVALLYHNEASTTMFKNQYWLLLWIVSELFNVTGAYASTYLLVRVL